MNDTMDEKALINYVLEILGVSYEDFIRAFIRHNVHKRGSKGFLDNETETENLPVAPPPTGRNGPVYTASDRVEPLKPKKKRRKRAELPQELLKPYQIRRILNLSRGQLNRLILDGMPAIKVGNKRYRFVFDLEAAKKWLFANRGRGFNPPKENSDDQEDRTAEVPGAV